MTCITLLLLSSTASDAGMSGGAAAAGGGRQAGRPAARGAPHSRGCNEVKVRRADMGLEEADAQPDRPRGQIKRRRCDCRLRCVRSVRVSDRQPKPSNAIAPNAAAPDRIEDAHVFRGRTHPNIVRGHRRGAFALDFLEPLVSDRLEIILRSERFCDFVEFGLFYRVYSFGEESTRLQEVLPRFGKGQDRPVPERDRSLNSLKSGVHAPYSRSAGFDQQIEAVTVGQLARLLAGPRALQ